MFQKDIMCVVFGAVSFSFEGDVDTRHKKFLSTSLSTFGEDSAEDVMDFLDILPPSDTSTEEHSLTMSALLLDLAVLLVDAGDFRSCDFFRKW